MSTVQDIVNFAIEKNPLGLKGALDDIMLSKVTDQVSQMAADITSSVFSSTTGMEQDEIESQPEETVSNEGTPADEVV